jgi:hypothetical protein
VDLYRIRFTDVDTRTSLDIVVILTTKIIILIITFLLQIVKFNRSCNRYLEPLHFLVQVAQKSVNLLLKFLLNYRTLEITFLVTEFTNIFRNEILRFQWPVQKAVILIYRLISRFTHN